MTLQHLIPLTASLPAAALTLLVLAFAALLILFIIESLAL